MKVKDIMKKKVIFVSPDTKINEVAEVLTKNKIHGVPVIEDGKLAGIITTTDFFIKDSPNFYLPSYIDFIKDFKVKNKASGQEKKQLEVLMSAAAKDIMTRECITVLPETEMDELLKIFREKRLHLLPVANGDNSLAGIVSLADVVKLVRV